MNKIYALLLSACLLYACHNENEAIVEEIEKPSLRISDFQQYGELHNAIMDKVNNDFVNPSNTLISVNAYMDSLCEFNTRFVCGLNSSEYEEEDLLRQFRKHKNLLNAEQFSESVIAPKSTRSDKKKVTIEELDSIFSSDVIDIESLPSLDEMADVLYEGQLISHNGYLLLKDIITSINDAYLGLSSDAVFEERIEELVQHYEMLQYDTVSIEGKNLGTTLTITKSSLEWWKNHPEAYESETKAVQTVVVNDASGAVVGVIGSCLTGSRFSWKSILWGAASASVGVISKIGKFFDALGKLLSL